MTTPSRPPMPETTVPSGCIYTLWANGDGLTVQNANGMWMHDAGSHVKCIPLCDVEHVATLVRAHRGDPHVP